MPGLRQFAFCLLGPLLFAGTAAHAFAQRAGKAQTSQSQPKQQPQPRQQAAPNQGLGKHPGEEILQRLSSMTQAEREQVLSKFPPAQRENIEKRIQNFQKMPPAQQERTLQRLERLNSLPPARQVEVRRSMNQFNKLPQPRKAAINQELRHIQTLPDDERQPYVASDSVGARFSPDEQRIMGDMADILPHHDQ
jgi:hypothetical protein